MRSSSCLWLASMNTCLLPSFPQLGANGENLRKNIYRLVCVVTEHTFMLGSIFGKQSTCLNADGVGVNCIFAISFMSWHDDILKYNSRSVSCLFLSTMQMQTFSKMYVGLAGAVWCYSAHRFFLFSISPEHNAQCGRNAAIRQERVGEMPVSSFIIYGHYNLPWHPMLYSTHTSYLLFPFKTLLVKCGDVSCIERTVILYDVIDRTELKLLQTEG